jgi:hypothetical protein
MPLKLQYKFLGRYQKLRRMRSARFPSLGYCWLSCQRRVYRFLSTFKTSWISSSPGIGMGTSFQPNPLSLLTVCRALPPKLAFLSA